MTTRLRVELLVMLLAATCAREPGSQRPQHGSEVPDLAPALPETAPAAELDAPSLDPPSLDVLLAELATHEAELDAWTTRRDREPANVEPDRCSRICGLASSICGLQERICALATAHADEPDAPDAVSAEDYAAACTRATNDCERATTACETCNP